MSDGPRFALPQAPMRSFLIVFSGQACSLFGSELVQFALIWWLTLTSGSATTLAVAALVGLLPPVVLGPLIGALVDRWDRRRIMMAADAAIAAATLLLAALFALGGVQVGHVYALLFVRALGSTFHWPAMQASTTLMVPERHLARVAGIGQALRGVASIAMPPLAAILLASMPIAGLLAIDVVTAIVAITPLVFIAIPRPARQADAQDDASPIFSIWADLRSGFRFVWQWRGLTLLVGVIAVLHFWAVPALSLVPIVVVKVFERGAEGLAWTQSAAGAGFVAGGLLLGIWGGFHRRIVTVLLGIACLGAALGSIGALPQGGFSGLVAAVFAAGVLAPMVVGSFQAIQQAVVPPEMQGRVMAIARSGMDLMSPIGLAVAGPVADAVGVRHWYLLTGTVMVVMAAAAFFSRSLMTIEERHSPGGLA